MCPQKRTKRIYNSDVNAKEAIFCETKWNECNLHADGLLKLVAAAKLSITQNSLELIELWQSIIIGVFDVGDYQLRFASV